MRRSRTSVKSRLLRVSGTRIKIFRHNALEKLSVMGFCLLLLLNSVHSLHFPAVTGYQSITKKDREVFRLTPKADLFPSDFMNMFLDCERTIQTPQQDPTGK